MRLPRISARLRLCGGESRQVSRRLPDGGFYSEGVLATASSPRRSPELPHPRGRRGPRPFPASDVPRLPRTRSRPLLHASCITVIRYVSLCARITSVFLLLRTCYFLFYSPFLHFLRRAPLGSFVAWFHPAWPMSPLRAPRNLRTKEIHSTELSILCND